MTTILMIFGGIFILLIGLVVLAWIFGWNVGNSVTQTVTTRKGADGTYQTVVTVNGKTTVVEGTGKGKVSQVNGHTYIDGKKIN